jgi:hypothetical protein
VVQQDWEEHRSEIRIKGQTFYWKMATTEIGIGARTSMGGALTSAIAVLAIVQRGEGVRE